jgi:hypothetical protein
MCITLPRNGFSFCAASIQTKHSRLQRNRLNPCLTEGIARRNASERNYLIFLEGSSWCGNDRVVQYSRSAPIFLRRIKTARCTEPFVMTVGAIPAALLPLSPILAVQPKLAVSRYRHNTYHPERNTNVRTSANTHLGSSEKSTTASYQL